MSEERQPDSPEQAGAPGPPPASPATEPPSTPAAAEELDTAAPAVPPTAIAAGGQSLTGDGVIAVLRAVFAADWQVLHWLGHEHAAGAVARGLPTSLQDCLEGRAWGLRGEVRWKRIDPTSWSVLYLGHSAACPAEFNVLADDLREVEAPPLRLWGKRGEDGLYRAERLAVALAYPGLAAEVAEATLPCRHLVDRQGVVRFVRLAWREEEP